MTDLMQFCSKTDENFKEPFSDATYTYASDGHAIIVRVPRIEGHERPFPLMINPFPKILSEDHYGEIHQIPDYAPAETIPCDSCGGTGQVAICGDCDGDGEVYWKVGLFEYTAECKKCRGDGFVRGAGKPCEDCDGTGKITLDDGVRIDRVKLSRTFLDKIKALPQSYLIFPYTPGAKPIHFVFNGGYGAVMPMRDK